MRKITLITIFLILPLSLITTACTIEDVPIESATPKPIQESYVPIKNNPEPKSLTETKPKIITPTPKINIPVVVQENNCHPGYSGACLKINAGDYDCAGGSGNGPNYTGKVRVIGPDEFDLDRDNDGWGCE